MSICAPFVARRQHLLPLSTSPVPTSAALQGPWSPGAVMAPQCTASARRCCPLWAHRGGMSPLPQAREPHVCPLPKPQALQESPRCWFLAPSPSPCRESSPCRRADLLRCAGAHLGVKAPSRACAQPRHAAGFLCHPQESGCPSGALRLYTQPHRELSIPGCLSAVLWPCQGCQPGAAPSKPLVMQSPSTWLPAPTWWP